MKTLAALFLFCALGINVAYADTTDKAVFDKHCRKCHDDVGTGTFMLNRRLGKDKALLEARTDLAPVYIRHVVRNGVISMPWISRVEVTDEELDSIVRYLTRNNH
jgi:cytochrome c5